MRAAWEVAIPSARPQHRVDWVQVVRTWARAVAVVGALAVAAIGLNAARNIDLEFRPTVLELPPDVSAILFVLALPIAVAALVLGILRGGGQRPGRRSTLQRWLVLLGILLMFWALRRLLERKEPRPLDTTQPPEPSGADLVPGWSPEATGVVIALVAVAVALLLWRRRRARHLHRPRPVPPPSPSTLDAAGSVADPAPRPSEHDDDLRSELVRHYAAMEADLAGAGFPRRPTETHLEFLDRTTSSGRVPATPATRLTRLFATARYSRHAVLQPEVEAARTALTEIQSAMHPESRSPDSPGVRAPKAAPPEPPVH